MHAAHKQAMTSNKLIITQQAHYSTGMSLNIENPVLISLIKITSLQEIHLVKLFIQLWMDKGPALSPCTVASFFVSNIEA
jgi:hypothetical protein